METTASRVRAVLERHVAAGAAPGAVALVGRGWEAEVVVVGNRAKESPGPMRRDGIFRIASMTKPILAAAALQLVEEGRLRLDEPVDRFLPELADRRVLKQIGSELHETVPARRPITLEDLLTFRCGLGIVLAPPGTHPIQQRISELGLVGFGPPDPASPLGPDEWLAKLGTLPLMAQPGEQWMYNTGSYVLGVLLARASRVSLPQLLHERLFAPLGMQDTAFFVPPDKRDRLVSAYVPKASGLELCDAPDRSVWTRPPAFPDGGAGLVSTAEDYFAFSRLALGRGEIDGRRLLSEASIAAMTRDHLTAGQRAGGAAILGGRGWGLGVSVVMEENDEGLPPGAFGWSGGLGTSWLADPATGRSAILLTQTLFASPEPPAIHRDFWRVVSTRD